MRSQLDVDLLSTSSFASEVALAGPFQYTVQKTARCDFRDSLLAILQIIVNKHPRPGIQRTPDEILDDCLSRAVVYCNAYRSSEGDEELWNSSTLLDGHLQEYAKEKLENNRHASLKALLNTILGALLGDPEDELKPPIVKCPPELEIAKPSDFLFCLYDKEQIINDCSGLVFKREPSLVLASFKILNKTRGDVYKSGTWDTCAKTEEKLGLGELGGLDIHSTAEVISSSTITLARNRHYTAELVGAKPKYTTSRIPDANIEFVAKEGTPASSAPGSHVPLRGHSTHTSNASLGPSVSAAIHSTTRNQTVVSRRSATPASRTSSCASSGGLKDSEHLDSDQITRKPHLDSTAPEEPTTSDNLSQCALYAAERLMSKLSMTFVNGLLIKDASLYFWWYTREGMIQSSGIDFIQSLPYLVVLLMLLQRVENDFGTETALGDQSNIQTNGRVFRRVEGDALYETYHLLGRRACVSSATEPNVMGDETKYVVKVYWPEEAQQSEVDVIQIARKRAKLLRGSAKEEMITDHLPTHQDFFKTSTLNDPFRFPSKNSRVMRAIIFKTLNRITTKVGNDIVRPFLEVMRCHFSLWLLGVNYCDISVANTLVDPDNGNGILNDFDLAVIVEPHSGELNERRGADRTATLPFMDIDLLRADGYGGKLSRLYRHDLESFCWCFVWICLCFDNDKERIHGLCEGWLNPYLQSSTDSKVAFGTKVTEDAVTESYKLFGTHVVDLGNFWTEFHLRKNRKRQDFEEPTKVAILRDILKIFPKCDEVDMLWMEDEQN